MKIEAATRLQAAAEDLVELNKLTGWKVTPSQAEGRGWRLTYKQDRGALDAMLKAHGNPIVHKRVNDEIHRVWEIEGHKVAMDYHTSKWGPAIVYLE